MIDYLLRVRGKLLWSLRKLRLPIRPTDKVLEVGSGGNPHPMSDILMEKYLDNTHRLRAIKIDRETVLADACRMPFRDKSFDYIIAFHVLEHVATPEVFLDEMTRVGRAGYIETPNVLYERVKPLEMHLLEVAERDGTLRIRKKPSAFPDPFLSCLDLLTASRDWMRLFDQAPEAFHVCFRWSGTIRYEIDNPQTSLNWFNEPQAGYIGTPGVPLSTEPAPVSLRSAIIGLLRRWAVIRKRNNLRLDAMLVCPQCHGALETRPGVYRCVACSLSYRREPVIDFTVPLSEPADLGTVPA
jgi:SAM-dependent methyltransferase